MLIGIAPNRHRKRSADQRRPAVGQRQDGRRELGPGSLVGQIHREAVEHDPEGCHDRRATRHMRRKRRMETLRSTIGLTDAEVSISLLAHAR